MPEDKQAQDLQDEAAKINSRLNTEDLTEEERAVLQKVRDVELDKADSIMDGSGQ